MGVYIPGMEIPKSCGECGFKRYGACIMAGYRSPKMPGDYLERPDWCPLVPVPPHGRLGDLDALLMVLDDLKRNYPPDSIAHSWIAIFRYAIDATPTIIPADKENALIVKTAPDSALHCN